MIKRHFLLATGLVVLFWGFHQVPCAAQNPLVILNKYNGVAAGHFLENEKSNPIFGANAVPGILI